MKKKKKETSAKWTDSFAGKWQDERTAEEIVADLRSSRTLHHRDIEL
jgi:hypothetical protein